MGVLSSQVVMDWGKDQNFEHNGVETPLKKALPPAQANSMDTHVMLTCRSFYFGLDFLLIPVYPLKTSKVGVKKLNKPLNWQHFTEILGF